MRILKELIELSTPSCRFGPAADKRAFCHPMLLVLS